MAVGITTAGVGRPRKQRGLGCLATEPDQEAHYLPHPSPNMVSKAMDTCCRQPMPRSSLASSYSPGPVLPGALPAGATQAWLAELGRPAQHKATADLAPSRQSRAPEAPQSPSVPLPLHVKPDQTLPRSTDELGGCPQAQRIPHPLCMRLL